jgi:hypothetical protein
MALPFFISQSDSNKATKEQLARLQALAHLPKSLNLGDHDKTELSRLVTEAIYEPDNQAALKKIEGILQRFPAPSVNKTVPQPPQLEERDPDPEQANLNLQLALTALVNDVDMQDFARLHGRDFQQRFNLTNDQMLTLCRLAIDVGAYKITEDLENFIEAFGNLDPVIKTLSPGALDKLGIDTLPGGNIMGSCSCCCP